MPDNVTVKLKCADSTYSHKFAVTSLDLIQLSHDDKTLQRMVEQAQASCKDPAEEIEIKINFTW